MLSLSAVRREYSFETFHRESLSINRASVEKTHLAVIIFLPYFSSIFVPVDIWYVLKLNEFYVCLKFTIMPFFVISPNISKSRCARLHLGWQVKSIKVKVIKLLCRTVETIIFHWLITLCLLRPYFSHGWIGTQGVPKWCYHFPIDSYVKVETSFWSTFHLRYNRYIVDCSKGMFVEFSIVTCGW